MEKAVSAGTLFVVGLGPGAADLMTPRALAALERAPVILGYDGYLSLVPPSLLAGKTVIGTGMRQEIERCRQALRAVGAGQDAALVCSGDPGVYALASLALELACEDGLPLGHIEVVPGVTAVCAAAARLGAPLGHDFACLSLSDALTPWEVIEKRAAHALDGGFVLALYNPRSRSRPDGLGRIVALALQKRGAACAAGIVRLAERPGEEACATTLGELDVSGVDMFSLVIIGAAATRRVQGRLITPRGYLERYGPHAR